MRRVGIVFTNPGHHTEMMVPVAKSLAAAGAQVSLVSIAELRGLRTRPVVDGVRLTRAFPPVRSSPSDRMGVGGEGTTSVSRARRALWTLVVKPRLWMLLRRADTVIVPNDAAYPYRDLVAWCRQDGKRVVLLQEGIRFPLPNETEADAYGLGGADRICVWGPASAQHFAGLGIERSRITVTGNPRFDGFDLATWRERGRVLREKLGLTRAPLLFLSNPIDDQGFCSTADKLELFRAFVRRVVPLLARADRHLVVKLHAREDPAAVRAVIDAEAARDRVMLVEDAPFFAVLGAGHAAVVWASTAGLEALLFGLPLGALPVPGRGYAFDYVSKNAAHGLADDEALTALVEGVPATGAPGFLNDYVANRGRAAAAIRDATLDR